MRRYPLSWLGLLLGCMVFALAQGQIQRVKRSQVNAEIAISLPSFIQVVLAGGDRYLAASWSSIRALVTETIRMGPEDFRVLAEVQRDASWLNPAHEDNYYIAAAILPWEGQLEAAQTILRRATLSRPFDVSPPFYYAFNLVHFSGDGLGAAAWLRQAAAKVPSPEQALMLESFAVRWLDRSQDIELAARMADEMAAQTKRKDFADYLRLRGQRLRDLAMLRRAASSYAEKFGRPAATLADLVQSGIVKNLPADRIGSGFAIDSRGVPIFAERPRK